MSDSSKKNVLILFTDDQRFDALGAAGNPEIITPNMDKLVARGTHFTHAHIPCGTSGAVCMPSRAMLHTGRTLFHLQGAGESIPLDHITLGQAFKKQGYRTFGAGKWHNGREAFNRSFDEGDEIHFGGMADHWNVPAYHYDPSGNYDKFIRRIEHPGQSNAVNCIEADHIRSGEHSTDTIAGCVKDWLASYNDTAPFLAYVAFLAPHDPRSMPDKFRQMYNPKNVTLPPNFCGGHSFDTGALNIRDEMLAGFPRRPDEIRRHIAEYYAMISHLDDQFGQIFDVLEQKNMLDNTIIVFAGDNGLAVGQHGLMGKQNCYEHSVRVPLVFAGPGVGEGFKCETGCYLLDIYPTLCELCGVPMPDSVEGKSLAPCFTDEKAVIRDELLFAYTEFQRSLKKDGWKLIEYATENGHVATQLFDLANDRWEMNSIANNPAQQNRVVAMRKTLKKEADRWDDAKTEWGKTFWSRVDNKLFA